MDIADLQRRLRAASIEAICQESGVSRKTIQRLRAGQTGTLGNYLKVLAALDKLHPDTKRKQRAERVA